MATSFRRLFGLGGQSSATAGAANMVRKQKTPPQPTVPAAIQSAQDAKLGEGVEQATFSAGCFWGVEHLFNSYYSHLPGWKCVSGYAGGTVENPNYRQVCAGGTGHAESVQCTYQKGAVGYGELVEFFYRTHDPTTKDRQGPDRGNHYRSIIHYDGKEQEQVAKAVTEQVQEKYFKGKPIATSIQPIGKFWQAEDYHQYYLDNNPGGYECPTHFMHW